MSTLWSKSMELFCSGTMESGVPRIISVRVNWGSVCSPLMFRVLDAGRTTLSLRVGCG
jgi:hypothetical protein